MKGNEEILETDMDYTDSFTLEERLRYLKKENPELFGVLEEMQDKEMEVPDLLKCIENRHLAIYCEQVILEKDTDAYTLQDKLEVLKQDSPELFGILEEMQDHQKEVQDLLKLIENEDSHQAVQENVQEILQETQSISSIIEISTPQTISEEVATENVGSFLNSAKDIESAKTKSEEVATENTESFLNSARDISESGKTTSEEVATENVGSFLNSAKDIESGKTKSEEVATENTGSFFIGWYHGTNGSKTLSQHFIEEKKTTSEEVATENARSFLNSAKDIESGKTKSEEVATENTRRFLNSARDISESGKTTSEEVAPENAGSFLNSARDIESGKIKSEVVAVENAGSFLNSARDIESGEAVTQNVSEKKRCFNGKKGTSWFPIVVSIFTIAIFVVVVSILIVHLTRNGTGNDGPSTTHKYRFPATDFDECCGDEKKKRAYLEACSKHFKEEKIECTKVTRGSAIVWTVSQNKNHEKIIREKFPKLEHINSHSTYKGYYYGPQEEIQDVEKKLNDLEKEHADKVADLKKTHAEEIAKMKSTISPFEPIWYSKLNEDMKTRIKNFIENNNSSSTKELEHLLQECKIREKDIQDLLKWFKSQYRNLNQINKINPDNNEGRQPNDFFNNLNESSLQDAVNKRDENKPKKDKTAEEISKFYHDYWKEKNDKLEKENVELKQERHMKFGDLLFNNYYKELQNEKTDLKLEKQALEDSIVMNNFTNPQNKNKVNNLKISSIKILKRQCETLEKENAELKAQNLENANEMEKFQKTKKSLEKEKANLIKINVEEKKQMKVFQTEIDKLKVQKGNEENDIKSLKANNADLEQQIRNNNIVMENLQNTKRLLIIKNIDLEERNLNLKAKNLENTVEIKRLQKEEEFFVNENNNLEAKNLAVKKENQIMRNVELKKEYFVKRLADLKKEIGTFDDNN